MLHAQSSAWLNRFLNAQHRACGQPGRASGSTAHADSMSSDEPLLAALPSIFTVDRARKAGYDDELIQHMVRSGIWLRERRNVLVTAELKGLVEDDARQRFAVRAQAALLTVGNQACVSHESAAFLHGLVVAEPARITLTVPSGYAAPRSYSSLRVRPATLPPAHRTTRHGVPVTSKARTLIDVARYLDFVQAVVTGDDALHRGLVTPSQLRDVLNECRQWPYVQKAERAVAFMDGRRESPLESRSFVFLLDGGISLPTPQAPVLDEDGHLVARVDMLWEGLGVVGECDGKLKYANDPNGDSLWQEKRRQERLEGLGYIVVRWGWDDLEAAAFLKRRILAAHQRAVAWGRQVVGRPPPS